MATWQSDHIHHFYPRSPCGERRKLRNPSRPGKINFYPRSPCGERHDSRRRTYQQAEFLSTLSLRRATANAVDQILPGHISIHALLAESDPSIQVQHLPKSISIHALLAESDVIRQPATNWNNKFLSTLSLRRATADGLVLFGGRNNFYPRSPCGERPMGLDGRFKL